MKLTILHLHPCCDKRKKKEKNEQRKKKDCQSARRIEPSICVHTHKYYAVYYHALVSITSISRFWMRIKRKNNKTSLGSRLIAPGKLFTSGTKTSAQRGPLTSEKLLLRNGDSAFIL